MQQYSLSILFFGDGPWAHDALRRIVSEGYKVNKVIVRNDFKDPKLISIAEELGIPFGWHENVNSEDFLNSVAKFKSNLAVSMSFNQIIRKNTLEQFEHGFINCHAGKLPLYRGRNILNWTLINDEKEIGVTCHYIDEGIDTGDIILQETFPIKDTDDYGSVLVKAIDLCPKVLLKSIALIANGAVNRLEQPSEGTYFIQRKEGDEFIDWNWSSRRIFNFVRSITAPGPFAQTWLLYRNNYYKVLIKKAIQNKNAIDYICAEGAVIGVMDAQPVIKTGNNSIIISDYEILNCKKKKLRVGDRLGMNLSLLMSGKVSFAKN